jgi:hypothetical protein
MLVNDVFGTAVRLGTRLRILGPALLTAAVVAGCGSSGTPSSSSASASSGTSFSQCLKQHGVTLPSGQARPSGGPGGGGGGANASAIQACRQYAPAGGGFGGAGGGSGGSFANFTKCMKNHGVTLTGSGPAALQQLNRSSSKVQSALQACRSNLQPAGGGGG